MQPSFTVKMIGPNEAATMLARNTHNRNVRQRGVATLLDAIKNDEWMLTTDAVGNQSVGPFFNGQHRLLAIIESGTAVPLLVCDGVPGEVIDVIDAGRRRTVADALKLAGETNTNSLAAALNWLSRLESGKVRTAKASEFTALQAKASLAAHPGIRESLVEAERVRRQIKTPTALLAALHYTFTMIDPDDAEAFFEALATGAGLSETDARFVLRRMFINEQSMQRRLPMWKWGALVIKAWNAWRNGVEVRTLSFKSGGAAPEQFPTPI